MLPLTLLLSLLELVVTDSENSGEDLEKCVRLSVFARTCVGGDGLGRLGRNFVIDNLKTDRGWKTFKQPAVWRCVWLAINNQAQDTRVAAETLVGFDLLVDPF